jgi:ABC-2 type transport system ATP-binding protein
MNAIETHGLRYRAGRRFEIHDLDLHVPAGSIYGFLGPNGSGKTTVMRLVLGLLRPQAGRIEVLGRPMPSEAPAVLARVGYVPEQPHLDPTLTLRETLHFQAAFYPSWDWACAGQLLDEFGLDDGKPFGRLSKGQKGKLMMLLALAQRPDLFVLDEPTEGLDPVVRRDMLSALLNYVAHRGATILISSHLVHELERICDWIGIMDEGRLLTELPIQRLKNGIKRLRVSGAPPNIATPPFALLSREPAEDGIETWLVRDWEPAMQSYFDGARATLRDVIDLDLEDGFVELLRTFRVPRSKEW